MNGIGRNLQSDLKRFDMLEILPKGILELERFSVYFLGPLFIVLFSEYPPLHILRFKNENPEARYKDMVNLCRSIGGRESYVVH